MTSNLLADLPTQETSLMITSDERNPKGTPNNDSTTLEQQQPEAVVDDNANLTSVSVLSLRRMIFCRNIVRIIWDY